MTLLGVRAKNHPQQVGRRGADDATDDRRTPDELWQVWNQRYRFTLDAAASPENAKCAEFLTREDDALVHEWGGRVWCNPPYSNVGAWVEKAWREMDRGNCQLVVMLVPANRTEQRWWQEYVEPFRDGRSSDPLNILPSLRVEFLPGRMRFNRPGWTKPQKGDRPPFGLSLLIWERAQ